MFLISFRVGLFTFGGGVALTLMLQREYVDNQHWVDDETMVDVLAVARSLPGVVAVNTSLLAGYRIGGTAGALVATLGSVLPSYLVLVVVTTCYTALMGNAVFLGALRGVRGAVVALLVALIVRMWKQCVRDKLGYVFFLAALVFCLIFQNVSVIFVILAGLAAGLAVYLPRMAKKRGGDQ